MTQDEAYKHWHSGAIESFAWAKKMHTAGSNSLALFHCHLALEKELKALYLKKYEDAPPFTHNLQKLAYLVSKQWSDDHIAQLESITPFNQEARYGDETWVAKQATDAFTKKIIQLTDSILLFLSTHE